MNNGMNRFVGLSVLGVCPVPASSTGDHSSTRAPGAAGGEECCHAQERTQPARDLVWFDRPTSKDALDQCVEVVRILHRSMFGAHTRAHPVFAVRHQQTRCSRARTGAIPESCTTTLSASRSPTRTRRAEFRHIRVTSYQVERTPTGSLPPTPSLRLPPRHHLHRGNPRACCSK